MINCFPDLGELCWHIKRLWYIAECRHALWFVAYTVLLLGAWETRGIFREGSVCEWTIFLLGNPASENSWDLNVKQLHLNITQTQLYDIYIVPCSLPLVFCCLFAFLTGNIAFDPWHLVYKAFPHAAHWGSNEWQL